MVIAVMFTLLAFWEPLGCLYIFLKSSSETKLSKTAFGRSLDDNGDDSKVPAINNNTNETRAMCKTDKLQLHCDINYTIHCNLHLKELQRNKFQSLNSADI